METIPVDSCVQGQETVALPDLWRRRTQLSSDEMAVMYDLVRGALRPYHPLELQSLREDKEELVAQFIYAKVFRLEPGRARSTASADSAPSNNYALCAYFRRYLIDCLRSASHQHNVSIETEGIGQEVDEHTYTLGDPIQSELIQYGLDEYRVRLLAQRFIGELDRHEKIVLAGSFGRYRGLRGGLSGVAAQYGVPSYHYRALKLGVVLKKSARPEDFAATKIGRWITEEVGIAIATENRAAISLVLNLLGAESSEHTSLC
ncbi:hypothetical protein [Paraburkholderia flagellata]|uniref:hypothetical protein n=1 Tax=Paraburkholderia flagellata TaxID=2883241 RepID=UPI001F3CDF26|nr:hypothetical protein [Paraburkholderia flagellata]